MAIEKQIESIDLSAASYASKTTVVGQEDIPALGVREMQESVEYMPRNLLLPKLNEVVGAVNQCYTKAETDKAIGDKMTEIGAGDMAKAVYDPNGEGLNFTDLRTAIRKVEALQTGVDNLQYSNAGAHNAVYRGKALGSSVSEEQYTAIRAGTFDDLYIGDYWTIGDVTYRIAAFDYFLNSGDTECTAHHVVLVPDTCLYNAAVNSTNTTTGGYVGSAMHKTNLEQAKTIIKSAFSGHVLKRRIYLVNAVANGAPSAGAWADSEVDLMTERMVYGCPVFSPMTDGQKDQWGSMHNYTVEKSQLPLFQHEQSRICNRDNWWLRDIVSASGFAHVGEDGRAAYYYASTSLGVRPFFCIR